MEYYIDIKLRSTQEISDHCIMGEVYFRLHKALVAQKPVTVGVSFPLAFLTLGNTLRLHGSRTDLERLMSRPWLKTMEDYIDIQQITHIPFTHQHRVVRRVQVKSSPERIIRRAIRRGNLTPEEAAKKLATWKPKYTSLPYLCLKSASSTQKFQLFIEHGDLQENATEGKFSSYGLSSKTTIPWF